MNDLDHLLRCYGPYMTTQNIAECFHYSNERSVRNAIARKTLPVPTFRVGKRRFANTSDVADYFTEQRKSAQ